MLLKKYLLVLLFIPLSVVSQDSIPSTLKNTSQTNETSTLTMPIVFELDTLFFINNVTKNYPAKLRAKVIVDRLEKISGDYNTATDSIYLREVDDYIETVYNTKILFITTQNEAKFINMPILKLAERRTLRVQEHFNRIESLSTKEWAKRLGFFTVSLILLISLIKLINWLFGKLNIRLSKIEKTFLRKNRNLIKYLIPRKTANIFVFIANVIRLALIVILVFACAPFLFSFFPWAEHIVDLFYNYISKPVKYVVFGFIDFIPSLFFILVIAYITRYIVRVMREIARDVELEKLKIKNFHKDWANPTSKILGLFIYALALVMIFPYLPGSGSTAFQGVSIFIGAIISFGSTSAIANIIAGIVITYMRPFQIGDRVKVDQITGDVIEKTILVTRIRTPKNEDVTIPNANILVGTITNYSNTNSHTNILHTTITLGYDLPWQTAHKLLLEAANNVQLAQKDPKPFVHQTSLDDYYVSYELNVHTLESKRIPFVYSEIHKNILEVFNAAGVEILSPAYMAARDGNLTTVPSQLSPDAKSPINKLVDHLTGRNQAITKRKSEDPFSE